MTFDINKVLDENNQIDKDKLDNELKNLTQEKYREAALLICKNFYNVLQFFSYEKLGKEYSKVAQAAIDKQAAAIQNVHADFIEENTAEYGKLAKKAVKDNRTLMKYVHRSLFIRHKEIFAEILLDADVRLSEFPPYLSGSEIEKTVQDYSEAYKYVIISYFAKKYKASDFPQYTKYFDAKEFERAARASFFNPYQSKIHSKDIPKRSNDSSLSEVQFKQVQDLLITLKKEISSWPYPNKERKKLKMLGLMELISRTNRKEDVATVVDSIINKYPDITKGKRSQRTSELLKKLMPENTPENRV